MMFTTKKIKFGVMPKRSFIDDVQKEEKIKGIGPTTYKNVDPQHQTTVQDDKTGVNT